MSDYRVSIIMPLKDAYPETFIRAHIKRLPANITVLYGRPIPIYCGDDKRIDRYARRFDVHLMRAFLRRALKFPSDYFGKRALRDHLIRNKIDAVLGEFGWMGAVVADICDKARVPLIAHFHGADAYNQVILDRYNKEYKQLFSMASAIIAVSQHMKQRLLEIGAPPDKIFVIPYGVDTSFFLGGDPAASLPIFVAVGRFVDKKAPYLTLLAFKKVSDRRTDARLIMIGNGISLEACRQMAKALRISSSVEFAGVRTPEEIAETLRKARAFVQHSLKTSYGDSEGAPVAILEAGASGIPVVATRHSGIPEEVIDSETGFLVDEGDIDGMAERMLLLAEDPALAARMGHAAREYIQNRFSMEKSIGGLWHIIRMVIQKNGRGAARR